MKIKNIPLQEKLCVYAIKGSTFFRHDDLAEKNRTVYFNRDYFLRSLSLKECAKIKDYINEAAEQAPHLICYDSNADEELVLMGLFYCPDRKSPMRKLKDMRHKRLKPECLVGYTSLSNTYSDNTKVVVSGSYIEPEHRNKKLSRLFYQARLDWAAESKYKHALFEPFIDNRASIAAALSFGFQPTDEMEKDTVWGDRSKGKMSFYQLHLTDHTCRKRSICEVI